MSGPEFHQTGYGRKYFEADLPRLINALGRIADSMDRLVGHLEAEDIEVKEVEDNDDRRTS